MSNLFSTIYLAKLKQLIENFEISGNAISLLEFFSNELEKDALKKVNNKSKVFKSKKIDYILEINKSNELMNIYKYLKIIIQKFNSFKDELNLVIHVNSDLEENMIDNLISLFTWDILINSRIDKNLLDNEISQLEIITKKEIHADKNNVYMEYRKRYGQQHRLKLLKKLKELSLKDDEYYFDGVLINLNKNNEDLINLSEFSNFPKMKTNYVNFGKSLQEIYDDGKINLIDVKTIINIFPALRGQNIWINDFSAENIKSWNDLPDYNFNKLITITSGFKSYDVLTQQKKEIFKDIQLYVIFQNEINHLN